MARGEVMAFGPCCICDELFRFNPDRVPAWHGRPVCRRCVEEANVERVRQGNAPIVIYDDSYDALAEP